MADRGKKGSLPWGLSKDALKPNSVQSISKSKLAAFSMGMMNPLKRAAIKKKDEKKLDKKMAEAKETAEVFEEFVASFEDTGSEGKAFVRGSTFNPEKPERTASMSERPKSGLYKPPGRFQSEKKEEPAVLLKPTAVNQKPQKKKGTEKKKSILELFREELKRAQNERKDRHAKREAGVITLDEADEPEPSSDIFEVEEYKSLKSGSLGTGDSLTTNLYVGNINPNLNEEKLCQMFGKFGPLASIKVMWPRTEEERAKNRNCGFVAFMKREDAEKALTHFKDTTIMDYEVLVGWGKAVPLPPHPVYVPPDIQADEKAKHPDPPSGLPFNAQSIKKSGHKSGYVTVPPPGSGQHSQTDNKEKSFEDMLFDAMIRVVIPTDIKLLRLIHRVIEFVIREGPMFEAMIMNKEINNPMYQFLFDNQGPAHIYYRWKLFSILQGDSPETWCTDDFRMFVHGSLWKPPPLKNLRMKLLPPVEEDAVLKRGQLSASKRDDLEDQLRRVTMERGSIRKSMVWCLDHADSAEEIVDCISESLTIAATPLPMKLARLFLVSDILHNCSPTVRYSSNFRRGFESKLNQVFVHFSTLLQDITSRMRAENFRRRVLACVKSWDMVSIFHFHFLDKLRETFFGRSQEEVAKQKAFDTVAALMATKPEEEGPNVSEIDGVPLFDDRPIDFSGVGQNIDGVPLDQEDLDGAPLPEQPPTIDDDDMVDGVPLSKEADDLDGVPMETSPPPLPPAEPVVRSKWELVDYDSDEEEGEGPDVVVDQSQDTEKQLLSEFEEKKRKILRDVEVKVVELSDALESTGSYSKAEITQRVEKYRDKLMNEAVQPKITPPTSPRGRSTSRSPSPSILAKYELEDSPRKTSKSRSPKRSPKGKRSKSPRRESPSRDRSRKRSRSHSPPLKRRKSSERSTEQKRSPSPSRRRSRSPKRRRSRERSPARRRSSSSPSRKRSRTPQKSRKKSPSPSRKRSRSRSPKSRKKSSSPSRKKSRSRSPKSRKRSSSPSRKKSRSRSPQKRKRSASPSRKRSRSPRKRSSSPSRKRSRSRSPQRKRSRSPRKSRNRSRSPKSRRHKSRSKSPSKSSKKKKRSRSRSPHKSSKSGKKSSRH